MQMEENVNFWSHQSQAFSSYHMNQISFSSLSEQKTYVQCFLPLAMIHHLSCNRAFRLCHEREWDKEKRTTINGRTRVHVLSSSMRHYYFGLFLCLSSKSNSCFVQCHSVCSIFFLSNCFTPFSVIFGHMKSTMHFLISLNMLTLFWSIIIATRSTFDLFERANLIKLVAWFNSIKSPLLFYPITIILPINVFSSSLSFPLNNSPIFDRSRWTQSARMHSNDSIICPNSSICLPSNCPVVFGTRNPSNHWFDAFFLDFADWSPMMHYSTIHYNVCTIWN